MPTEPAMTALPARDRGSRRVGQPVPAAAAPPPVRTGAAPDTYPSTRRPWQTVLLWLFLIGPLVALIGGIVLAAQRGIGPSRLDAVLAVTFYAISGHGVTVGFHRYFTHGSFTATRPLRIALAVAGSLAVEGSVTSWVADHRRHHAHADQDGDPHSPWRFGSTPYALVKGLWWAQVGWFFAADQTNQQRYVPDLLADADIARVNRLFPLWAALSLLSPAALGGALTGSGTGALTALLWAGLVRMLLLHHVTWSINSICHVVGSRPFTSRDKATNVWPLAVISMGESWHNLHHAEPTCARHGVDPGQLDSSAALIRGLERVGWATAVRWPNPDRLDRRRRTLTSAASRPAS